MLFRSLLRCRRMPKLLKLNLLREYHPYAYDNKFNNRVLDYELVPPVGRLDFIQHENEYIHKLLASDKLYVNTIAFLDYLRTPDENCTSVEQVFGENYEDKPAYALLCYLKLILKSCKEEPALIQNAKVNDLCEALRPKLSELRDEHLWNLMKVLTLWPNNEEDQRFFNLCKAVDEEALQRSRSWGYDSILLTMDHFYRLRTLRYSEFVFNAMKRLWRNPGKLTPHQVVHAMFLVKNYKKWHPSVDMLDVESVLMFYIYDLTVEEVGVLAISFFKTQTTVININLVELMYKKLENRVNDVDKFTLTAFLKFFRQCTTFTLKHKMKELLDKLTTRIDELPIECCTHLALLGSRILLFHQPSLQKICAKFYDNMDSGRLKDLERLAFVLQLFNFTPDIKGDIFERIMESIRKRETEITNFPRTFLSALYYLSLRQYYDYELISKGLSITFLKKTFGSVNYHAIPLHVVHLSIGVRMECPDYKGSYLGEMFLEQLSKKVCRIPDSNKKTLDNTWIDLFSIRNMVCRIFGSEKYAHMMYLVPYAARPDIFFCMKDKQPIEIPKYLFRQNYLPLSPLPDLGGTWYAVVLRSKWNVVIETDQLIGSMLSKLRHLELLGCKTIQVDEEKYQRADKMQHIKDLIDKHTT